MTREEAIIVLKMVDAYGLADEAKRMAIKALEQNPKVTAKWQQIYDSAWIYEKCSSCGTVQDVKSNYCPACGAKMEGSEDGEII